jgi:ubiquinol-cytochrome c reductase cytochrome c1 subunit
MRSRLIVLFVFFVMTGFAAGDDAPIALESVTVDAHNTASIFRGAQYYAKNCMVCHTMKYLTHSNIGKKAGVTLDKMPLKKKEWWLGIVPPDLTLLALRRTPAWIYTYLHSFYKDESRPTGYNNLLVKDINMPNLFVVTQGIQVLTPRGKSFLEEDRFRKPHYYNVLELVQKGNVAPEVFDNQMIDLVNFFAYAATPNASFRLHVGLWVMLFLFVFLILTILLKRIYWKNVPKNK